MSNYNGYKTYNTWVVASVIDAMPELLRTWIKRANEIYDEANPDQFHSKQRIAKLKLASELRNWLKAMNPLPEGEGASEVFSELLEASLQDIDYDNLADIFLARYVEQYDYIQNII